MESLGSELGALRRMRRRLFVDALAAIAGGACLVTLAPLLDLAEPDIAAAFLAGVGVWSLGVVRGVASWSEGLQTPCPRCARAFFGGAGGALHAVPLPPHACTHCGIPLGR